MKTAVSIPDDVFEQASRVAQSARAARFATERSAATCLRKLRMLVAAVTLEDLTVPPANRLEKLQGDRAGQWSIRINDQWRICFMWRDGNAHNVEIADYH